MSDKPLNTTKSECRSLNQKGDHKTMASIASAKKVYAAKVCKGYLGIAEKGCDAAFDRLIDNMKAGYEALAPTAPSVPEVAAPTTGKK